MRQRPFGPQDDRCPEDNRPQSLHEFSAHALPVGGFQHASRKNAAQLCIVDGLLVGPGSRFSSNPARVDATITQKIRRVDFQKSGICLDIPPCSTGGVM